jgi:hypothetical protein
MPTLSQQGSAVAQLLAQISSEYEAAERGLTGLTQGTSQHQFITTRMERIGALHSELHSLLGDEAMVLIDNQLNTASSSEEATR